jgi:hypothetical protein
MPAFGPTLKTAEPMPPCSAKVRACVAVCVIQTDSTARQHGRGDPIGYARAPPRRWTTFIGELKRRILAQRVRSAAVLCNSGDEAHAPARLAPLFQQTEARARETYHGQQDEEAIEKVEEAVQEPAENVQEDEESPGLSPGERVLQGRRSAAARAEERWLSGNDPYSRNEPGPNYRRRTVALPVSLQTEGRLCRLARRRRYKTREQAPTFTCL